MKYGRILHRHVCVIKFKIFLDIILYSIYVLFNTDFILFTFTQTWEHDYINLRIDGLADPSKNVTQNVHPKEW